MDDATRRLSALLAPLTNYERSRPDRPRFTLDTMRVLLDRLGPAARVVGLRVQVGGSKGKGTTAAYLEALGRAAGMRTGVFASPHVSSILERVRLDGAPIDEARFTACCERVIAVGAGLDPAPSFFEVTTAAALLAFVEVGVDLAVLEVGLGGRLDATTAVEVDASVLTGVELEHTELLGDTVEAIAGEKAYVFRPGRVGLHACSGGAAAVVTAHARRVGCRLHAFGIDFGFEALPPARSGTRRLALRAPFAQGGEIEVEASTPGYEDRALALAFATLAVLRPGFPLPPRLERPALPGRFEVRVEADGVPLVLDGAHTEESARLLAAQLGLRFGGAPVTALFGSARGKRWREFLTALAPAVAHFACAEVQGTASEDPAELVAWLRRAGHSAERVDSAAAGLEVLRRAARPRLVTGSFYLVGAVRDALSRSG
jgi:dihydrofolate synthase/folylpolyglutamate synthase